MKKITATSILSLLLLCLATFVARAQSYHGIIYVTMTGAGTHSGDSWENAISSIEEAQIIAQAHNAVVWVATGTYYGDTTAVNAFAMHDGVNVYGGLAGNEPADYDLSLRDFEANVTFLDGLYERRVLCQTSEFIAETTWDGFTIRNGRTPINGPQPANCGGGVLIRNGNLSHCNVNNNYSYTDGGGIYAYSSAEIRDCKVINNHAGVYGGGIYVVIEHPVLISNCLVSNNTADYSGGCGICSWYNNYYNSYMDVVNTTIVNNSGGSGVFSSNGPSNYRNCIVWGNSSSFSGNVNCTYSAIQGGYSGEGNINLSSQNTGDYNHPFFVNPTQGSGMSYSGGDWHLMESSACINKGFNAAAVDSLDLDGNPRIKYDTVDIGCYEFQGSQNIPIGDAQPCADAPTVTDYDEIVYNTVRIGNQCWMKENLRTTHYSDGTIIPLGGYSSSESTPYRYCPNNNCDNVPAYGYLYNWSAVMHGMGSNNTNTNQTQGVCPEGWHVPSAVEWTHLLDYVKGQSVFLCGEDSNNIAKALANTLGWTPTQTECAVGNDVGQNNITGFGAMPAGNFYGPYDNFNGVAFYWTSSEANELPNYHTYSSTPYPIFYAINQCCSEVGSHTENKVQGFSVRCLKNDSLISDNSGIIYVTPSGAGNHSGDSWANAISSIEEAQAIAQANNAVVWVAAGTYYGNTTGENAFTMVDGVNVYGGFSGDEPADYDLSQRDLMTNKTVLDGQNARRVLGSSHFNMPTVWDGFTIQHGRSYTGAGVCLFTHAKISHCEIIYNYSITGGGGGVYADHGTVSNCLIANNTANWGGGLVALYSSVNNSTIVRNSTDYTGIYGDEYSILTNSIVWGNTTSDGTPSNLLGNIICSYAAIEGGYEGDNIIMLNDLNQPLFVNPSLTAGASDSTTNVDWHLQNGSVCVNHGNNDAVTDNLDLDGTARIKRDTVDLGCYESEYYSVPVLFCSTVYNELSETACDSYTWDDHSYTQSGDYSQTFPLDNGCDSIVTLHLTILPSTVGEFAAMTPTNNYPLTSYPIHFTWDAVENASDYDLYLWPVGEPQPQQPSVAHIHGTSYLLHSLPNRNLYQWMMKAYSACDTSMSYIRQFSLNVTPTLTVIANNPVDFGEVQLNSARSVYFQVKGIALDSVITYQLTGADTSAFTLVPTSNWDSMSGGRMQLTFHPTIVQNEYSVQMAFQSDDIVQTFTVKGYLADFLTFTTHVDSNIYAMDSDIPVHGQVINALNEPVAGLDVEVYVKVLDHVRTYPATSDANGQFTITFTPQHSEAGYYMVGSRRAGGNSTTAHDDFNIPGMMLVSSDWILWEPTVDQSDTGVIAVRNRSLIPLTNIQVTPMSLPNGCTVQFVPLNLAGMATGNLQYIVSSSEVSTGVNYEEVRLNAVSDEGAAMSFTAWYFCMPQRADLDITPISIATTMTRGKSKIVDFKIYNNGTGPTGKIIVSLPDVSWMSVVGSDTLPSLAVHDSAYVSIRLSADSTTDLVRYTGNFAVNCERGEGVSIPYSITAISDSTGTLVVDVTDEYTWNTNNGHGPHLAGANVMVKGYYSLETVATGVTDANGHFVVSDLPEGYYKLIVRADRHEEYQGVLEIVAGDTNRQNIFIQFQAITYSWEVVPTEIQDEYTYELNVEFETHVPAPVVTMDIDRQLPLLEDCETYTFNLIVTNHGLIAALDLSVIVPDYPFYIFTPLIGHIDSLPAQSTQIIPVVMMRKDCINEITGDILPQPTGINPVDPDATDYHEGMPCIKTVFKGQYKYHCDVDRWVLVYSRVVSFSYPVDSRNCEPDSVVLPPVPFRVGMGFAGPTAMIAVADGWGGVSPQITQSMCDSTVVYQHPCYDIVHAIVSCALFFIPSGWSHCVAVNSLVDKLLTGDAHFVRNSMGCTVNDVASKAVEVAGGTAGAVIGGAIGSLGGPGGTAAGVVAGEEIGSAAASVMWNLYQCGKNLYNSWDGLPDCWYYLRGEYPYIDSAMLSLKKGLNYLDYNLTMFERFVCDSLSSQNGDTLSGQIGCSFVRWKTAPAHILNDFVGDFVDSQLEMELPEYQIGQITLQKQDRLVEVYGSTLGDVTPDDIRMLCARWNNSVDYWNQGYYYYSDLPSTYDHNCIMFDNVDFDAAIDAEAYAATIGFSHPYEMYNSAVAMLNDFAQDYMNSHTSSSVCASVTVQFSQKMTMTREAFEGTLTINNGHESQPMQDIDVDFVIKDENGMDCTNLFQINFLSYNNMTGTNGNASLEALNTGSIVVQFIPTKQAAPEITKQYSFGGSFSFIDPFTGESMTYNLYPVDIMVHPCPDLYVNYFMQRDILGDDPLTEDRIEPIIPAELGVIIHNRGAGTAKNVLLETAEPRIIDNEKGLAIDFAMYGSAFNGQERQLGLMEIPFGNIEPNHTGVGEWWFTSTLLGHFVSYEAHVIHNNSFGNPDLSLVSSLDIHPLIHTVYAYGNLDDGINDFLVDDIEDIRNYPDSLYFSNGSRTAVATADSISFDHYVTPMDTIVILTLDPSRIGWNYEQTLDPGRGQYKLVSCTRNGDQQVIPLSNVWQTHVTIPVGADPVYENRLHIVDTLSNDLPTTYTLVFGLYDLMLEDCVPDSIDITAVACDSFTWHGTSYTESGDYPLTLTNVAGCDSVVTLHLTVNFAQSVQFADTACGSFLWNGILYTQSGTYTYSHADANGCTQVDTLHLTIHNPVHTAVTETACSSFVWNGITYTQSGTYTYGHLDANGCTQVDTLHLTINQPSIGDTTAVACDSFIWHGTTYTESGDYPLTLTNANGCDSVVTLHLTVNFAQSLQFADTACGSFVWHGTLYTESGTYTYIHLDANGCTQVDTLHLTVNHPVHTAVTETACSSFVWHGVPYTQSGTYTYGHLDENGCTQVDTLHLTIKQPSFSDTAAVACDSFTWHGTTYTQSGSYMSYQTNAAGCDSVVTLHLTITNTDYTDYTDVACDSYTWHGTTYTESGDYTSYQTNVSGCDSIVTLHLTIVESPALHDISGETTICINQFATYSYDISEPDYQYRWFKDNVLWVEDVPQVTLHETGEGSVLLTMSVADEGNGCAADTSLLVQVVNRIAPDTTVIRRKGSSNTLVCQPVHSEYGEVHYRWGYTNRLTFSEAVMPGDHNYCLYEFGIDTLSYLYWVETYLNNPIGEGCDNRSYYGQSYSTATSNYNANIVEAYMSNHSILLYANVLSPNNITATLYDVNGKHLLMREYGTTDMVSDNIPMPFASGLYFLKVMVGNQLYSFKLLKL